MAGLTTNRRTRPTISTPRTLSFNMTPIKADIAGTMSVTNSSLATSLTMTIINGKFIYTAAAVDGRRTTGTDVRIMFAPATTNSCTKAVAVSKNNLGRGIIVPVANSSLRLMKGNAERRPCAMSSIFGLRGPKVRTCMGNCVMNCVSNNSVDTTGTGFDNNTRTGTSGLVVTSSPTRAS